MEALQLKIFDVLTEKISVLEFEEWLYNSEEFMSQINVNAFYFDMVSINYKNAEWKKYLYFLIESNYSYDLIALAQTETICSEIINSKNINTCYDLISKLVSLLSKDFVYEAEYIAVHNFHSLYSRFDLIELEYITNSEFISEAKYLASLLLNKISNSKSLDEKINTLKIDLEKNDFVNRNHKAKLDKFHKKKVSKT